MKLLKRRKKSEIKPNLKDYFFVGRPNSVPHLQLITKESILARDLHNLNDINDSVKENLEARGDSTLWNIKIQWDADNQKIIFQNMQIRAWHNTAHANFPYLPIFFTDKTLGPYLAYLLDIKRIKARKPDMVIAIYFESLVNLLSDIVKKGIAFFEYFNAIIDAGGIVNEIDNEKILYLINDFVGRSLRSFRIDDAELNEYKDAIRSAK